MVKTLNIAGGEHLLVSKEMLGKDYFALIVEERNTAKDKLMAVCFILRSNEGRYKKLLEDLKSSANRGRDEYPETFTSAFDLLVRESGEYDTARAPFNWNRDSRYRGRG